MENGAIALSHELFAQRVLILTDMPKEVTLCAVKGKKQVTVRYLQMNYLGIWKCLGSDDPNKIHLPAGNQYTNDWSITID